MKKNFLPLLASFLICFGNVHAADQTGQASSQSSSAATSRTWQNVGLAAGAIAIVTVAIICACSGNGNNGSTSHSH